MTRSFLIWLLVIFFLNSIVSIVCQALIPNYYIAEIVTSVILSFIFAIIQEPDRAHFYRSYGFWVRFLVCAIVFLLFDLLYFLLMRLAYGA
ncbi:MAG: hypothetical protein PUA93_03310 [Eubacteriales bacterium]|nr:hypothetical protein [Eubacteriales bacterium]